MPESMAHRLFGKESAIGKQIVPDGGIWTKPGVKYLVVGGVYKDFPENTQLKNVIYTEMSPDYALTNWISSNYFCYVMLDPSASPKEVAENLMPILTIRSNMGIWRKIYMSSWSP